MSGKFPTTRIGDLELPRLVIGVIGYLGGVIELLQRIT